MVATVRTTRAFVVAASELTRYLPPQASTFEDGEKNFCNTFFELDQKFLEVSHALMTIGNFLLLLLQVIAIDQQSYLWI